MTTLQLVSFGPKKLILWGCWVFVLEFVFELHQSYQKWQRVAPVCDPSLMVHFDLLSQNIIPQPQKNISTALPIWGHSDRPPQTKIGCVPTWIYSSKGWHAISGTPGSDSVTPVLIDHRCGNRISIVATGRRERHNANIQRPLMKTFLKKC